ncbi:hypothetical protein MHTCC0001_11700 [Flavobacteriaceae bacterium MHTCC 0001]
MEIGSILKKVGSNIKTLRKQEKLTQEELAKLINVSKLTIINIEKGRNASFLTLVKILKYFDCDHILSEWEIDTDSEPISLL